MNDFKRMSTEDKEFIKRLIKAADNCPEKMLFMIQKQIKDWLFEAYRKTISHYREKVDETIFRRWPLKHFLILTASKHFDYLTQERIAELVGCSQSLVSQVLKKYTGGDD